MMKDYTVITDLEERLSSPGFSNEVEDGRSLPQFSYYTCVCGQPIRFEWRHLQEAGTGPHTELTESEAREIAEVARAQVQPHDDFLDFHCPKCKNPVRLYFRTWAGGRHGDAGADWRFIVEGRSESPTTPPTVR